MIDSNTFNSLTKSTAKSFGQQKALIKKVMAGQRVCCENCQQELKLLLPEDGKATGIFCQNGCTDIALDFS